jgi:carbon monoxide dehydrogenase subunit G
MNMTGEQRIPASCQKVWEALNDPEILRVSIPGCESLDKESNDRFTAALQVKVGPIGARFKGVIALTDPVPLKGYTLTMEGNGGMTGSVKAIAKVRLREEAGSTVIVYDVESQIAGRMAQLGGPIIDATARQLAGKFFARFGEIVGGISQDSARVKETPSPAVSASSSAYLPGRAPALSGSLPIAWILATVVAVLAGFLIGRSHSDAGSDWAGVAIGLLVIVVAGAAFEYGRRAAAPLVILDREMLRQLMDRGNEAGPV